MLLTVDGEIEVSKASGERLTVPRGRSVWIAAGDGPVWVSGTGTAFRATDGLPGTPGLPAVAPRRKITDSVWLERSRTPGTTRALERPGMSGLWRTKSVEQSIQDTDEPGHKLKRTLSAWDLTIFGVAVVIGAGIFTLTARVAATTAGPAVSISFVIAAIACGLAAMCYAEFASTVPVAGLGLHLLLRDAG